MGDVVLGVHLPRRGRHVRVEVPVIADDLAGLARRVLHRRLEGRRIVAPVRPVVPYDRQRLAALDGGPRIARDDGDATQRIELGRRRARLDLHHAHDSGHLERRGGVEAHHLAAVHGWTRDDRVEHAGQARVDAVLGLAGHDVASIDELHHVLADVAELRRILEAHGVPCRDRPGWPRPWRASRSPRGGPSWRARPRGSSPPPRSTGTPQRAAAAASSMVRAAAPHRRMGSKKCRVLREPSVSWLPKRFSSPVACTTRTRFQSASSSSATIIGMPVRTPCPISDRWQTMRDRAVSADGHEHERIVHPAIGHAVGAELRRIGGAQGRREPGREHEPAERGHALEEAPPAHVGEDRPARRSRRPAAGALIARLPAGPRPA